MSLFYDIRDYCRKNQISVSFANRFLLNIQQDNVVLRVLYDSSQAVTVDCFSKDRDDLTYSWQSSLPINSTSQFQALLDQMCGWAAKSNQPKATQCSLSCEEDHQNNEVYPEV